MNNITYKEWEKLMNDKFSNPASKWTNIKKLDDCLEKINASTDNISLIIELNDDGGYYESYGAKSIGIWDGKKFSDIYIKRNHFKEFRFSPNVELFPDMNPKEMLWDIMFDI